jgi:hypothetical protein
MKNKKAPVDMKWCIHDKKKQEDQQECNGL